MSGECAKGCSTEGSGPREAAGGGDADGGSLAVSCDVSSSNTGVNACGAWVGEGKSLEWLERDRSENGGSGHEGADAEGTPRGEAQACGDVGNAKTL